VRARGRRRRRARAAPAALRRGLRSDREQLLAEAEAAVGKETAALQQALAAGVHSLEEANRVVQGALQVLDEVLPAIAWQRVRAQVPEASGEPA
jgi:hypothetical protein